MSDKSKKLKEKIKQTVKKLKERKKTEGRPNIEGISHPKKQKPKKKKEEKKKKTSPGSVSIGPHGGRYVQEASGHKRYVSEGKLTGTKKFKKSDYVKNILEDLIKKGDLK